MSVAARRRKLLDEQKERVFRMFAAGTTDKDILHIEGIDETTLKIYKREAKQAGLPIKSGVSSPTPHGIAPGSLRMRLNLGRHVKDMLDREGWHPLEIARDLGITQKNQRVLRDKGSPHDWRLSELQRLADLRGVSFSLLMVTMLQPDQFASKEEHEAWNCALKALNTGKSASGSTPTRS